VDGISPLVCPVIVGRDDLIALGARRLDETVAGRGHLLLVAGEAGIGKTRLVEAFADDAAGRGISVVRGATYPRDLEVAGSVFVDLASALGRAAPTADASDHLMSVLTRPDGAASRGRRATVGDAHQRRRLRTLEAADVMARMAATGPIVLVLEDLHWADDLSLEIVEALARRLASVPMLVVGTYRSDELYPRVPMREWRARLITARLAEELRLGRLTADGVATMASLLTGVDAMASDDLTALQARSDGVPLHVEELLAAITGEGAPNAQRIRTAAVPDTLEAAIVARLDHRSAAARRAATTASVVGRSFGLDLLATVLDEGQDAVAGALGELADHFVIVRSARPGGADYDFRHALIRDAIYARIPAPERRRLHGRVADAAMAAGLGSNAFLSAHFEQAGRRPEAYATARAAAEAADRMSSNREAHDLYRRALAVRSRSLPAVEHARLLAALGRTAAAVDDNDAAATAFEAAREQYLTAGLPVSAATVVAPLVAARHLLGDGLPARMAPLEGALRELDAVERDPQDVPGSEMDAIPAVRAALLAAMAAATMLDRRLDASIAHGEAAIRAAVAAGERAVELDVMATVGSDLVFSGRMDDGWTMLETAVERARRGGLEAQAARAYRMLGSCASVLVEYEHGEQWLRDGVDYAERVELWNHRHYMASHLAHVLWATGRWEEAQAVAAHALADGRGGVTTRVTALVVLGYLALGRGDDGAARAALEEARAIGERMGELQRLSPALWGLAELALRDGDIAGAIAACETGRAASSAVEDAAYLFPFLVTGTRAHLAAAGTSAARRWVDDVAGELRHRSIPGSLPAIDHAEGLVALATGSTGRARRSLEAAATAWAGLRRTWEGTAASLDLAACHLRANRPGDAVRLATDARDAATRLPAPALVARADDLSRAARTRGGEAEPWAPLTTREYEVARLIAAGQTNPAIARTLGVAPRTVSAHVEHILAKLGAERRAEIAAWTATVEGGAVSAAATPDRAGPVPR
jgi:DNA-binding CsgD family transcriptional regulator/tetratricopeptide (TPR) repeat protein